MLVFISTVETNQQTTTLSQEKLQSEKTVYVYYFIDMYMSKWYVYVCLCLWALQHLQFFHLPLKALHGFIQYVLGGNLCIECAFKLPL